MVKKILIVANGSKFGGAELQTLELAKAFREQSKQVTFLLNDDQFKSKFQEGNFEVKIVKFKHLLSLKVLHKAIIALIKILITGIKGRYDICIVENKHLLPLCMILKNFLFNKLIVYCHYPPGEFELKRCLYQYADLVVLCTAQLENYFTKYKNLQFFILNNFSRYEPKDYRREVKEQSTYKLLSVGHVHQIKNQLLLIDLAAFLKNSKIPFELSILGPYHEKDLYYQDCVDKIKYYEIEKEVMIKGHVDDLTSYYEQADLYLQPSIAEGLPLSILEAMAYGLPVIASRIDGIPEAVQDGINGELFDISQPDSHKIFFEKVAKLLENSELRQHYSHNSREIYLNNFSSNTFHDRVKELSSGLFYSHSRK